MAGEHQSGIRPIGCNVSNLGNLAPYLYTGELVIVTDDDSTKDVVGLRIADREPNDASDLKIVPLVADVPSSSTDTGFEGQIAYDASYFYVCRATDTWERIAWDGTAW